MSTPGEFLKLLLGRPVVVKLNSGVDYRYVIVVDLKKCLGEEIVGMGRG